MGYWGPGIVAGVLSRTVEVSDVAKEPWRR